MITIDRKELSKALSSLGFAISKSSTLPILSNILLEASDDLVHLTATNLEVAIRVLVPANVEEVVKTTIFYKKLSDLVNAYSSNNLKLDTDQISHKTVLKSGRSRAKLSGMDAREYPQIPERQDLVSVAKTRLDSDDFIKAVKKVAFAAETTLTRPIMNTVNVMPEGDECRFVATDGYQMGVGYFDIGTPLDHSININGINALVKVHKSWGGDELWYHQTQNQTHFVGDNFDVTVQNIVGTYPDISMFLSEGFKSEAIVDRDELIEAVKIVSIIAMESNGAMYIEGDKDLTFKGLSAEYGESQKTLECESYTGVPMQIAVNTRYLLSVLNQAGDKVKLAVKSAMEPLVVFDTETRNRWIIMPIHFDR